mmetsp:Transcript_8247/g.18464  ORF Transcript_8247/g.18464 Transcript_8247/m.18464 type:complete len:220 (+) Transcript_8247:726-1385(+)
MLQGRCRTGPVLHLPVRHAGDECSQLQHLRGKALPGELQGQACGLVLFAPARGLQDSQNFAIGHLADHQLEEDDAHAENISFGIPVLCLPGLRRNISSSATTSTGGRKEAFGQTKIDENQTRLFTIGACDHDVLLLDVAMHDCLRMEVLQSVQTLLEDYPPPVLTHRQALIMCSFAQLGQITSKVGFVDQVEEFAVLEDLEGFSHIQMAEILHQSVLCE